MMSDESSGNIYDFENHALFQLENSKVYPSFKNIPGILPKKLQAPSS